MLGKIWGGLTKVFFVSFLHHDRVVANHCGTIRAQMCRIAGLYRFSLCGMPRT